MWDAFLSVQDIRECLLISMLPGVFNVNEMQKVHGTDVGFFWYASMQPLGKVHSPIHEKADWIYMTFCA